MKPLAISVDSVAAPVSTFGMSTCWAEPVQGGFTAAHCWGS